MAAGALELACAPPLGDEERAAVRRVLRLADEAEVTTHEVADALRLKLRNLSFCLPLPCVFVLASGSPLFLFDYITKVHKDIYFCKFIFSFLLIYIDYK